MKEVYTKANSLNSLPSKEENYAEDDRNFRLTAEQLEATATLMETLYELFGLRSIMEANHSTYFVSSYHISIRYP